MKQALKKIANKFGVDIKKYKNNDPYQKQALFFYPQIPSIIFDVGAYDGRISRKYRKLFPVCKIFAFEPYPESFNKLSSQAVLLNYTPVNAAVTDKNGTAFLHCNNFDQTNSLYDSSKTNTHVDELTITNKTIEVKTITLDSFCSENKIDQIDILKLDIQGGELNALIGSKNLLENQKISLIYTEVEFDDIYVNQPLFYDVALFLKKYNYQLYNIYNQYFHPNGKLAWADAIFISLALQNKIS